MANKSSFMLAVLFIVNPFMLLFFQNCSGKPVSARVPASVVAPVEKTTITETKSTPTETN